MLLAVKCLYVCLPVCLSVCLSARLTVSTQYHSLRVSFHLVLLRIAVLVFYVLLLDWSCRSLNPAVSVPFVPAPDDPLSPFGNGTHICLQFWVQLHDYIDIRRTL